MFVSYIDHKKSNKVPESFPGTTVINPDVDDPADVLHENYRRYEGGVNEEFAFLVEYIMPAMYPSSARMGELTQNLISEIYTASDEAFALVVMYRDVENWDKQIPMMEEGKKGREIRMRSKMQDNGREKWSQKAIRVYRNLKKHVELRRQESKEMEEQFRLYMRKRERCDGSDKEEDNNDDDPGVDLSLWDADEYDEHQMAILKEAKEKGFTFEHEFSLIGNGKNV